jgi:phage FluMu protein Com
MIGKQIQYIKKSSSLDGNPCFTGGGSSKHTIFCIVCEKRVFDVYDPPAIPTRIEIKCPHCRKVVDIPISKLAAAV